MLDVFSSRDRIGTSDHLDPVQTWELNNQIIYTFVGRVYFCLTHAAGSRILPSRLQ